MSNMLRTRLEKVIAGTMYGQNPNMSGDPRRRLMPHERQKVEDCAYAVLEEMREPGAVVIAAVEDKAEERYNACPGMLRWYGQDVWAAGIDAALGESLPGLPETVSPPLE